MKIIKFLLDILNKTQQTKPLGRWGFKTDVEKWMLNYHPEPGYPNSLKEEWKSKQR